MKTSISNQQKKILSDIKDQPFQLSIFEAKIIDRIRGVRFGSITVHITDGVPQRTENKFSEMLMPEGFK